MELHFWKKMHKNIWSFSVEQINNIGCVSCYYDSLLSDLPFCINFVILSSLLIQFCKEKLVVPDMQIWIDFYFFT
jgi:hypothetical protein